MCLTSSVYPIKARPAKCLEIQLHPKKRWSSGARLKLQVKTAQKVAIPRFMYCLNIFFEKKNIAFKYYCSFKRYTLENCLAVGVWGLYFKNLLFKFDMFDYSEGRGREVSHSPRNKHMYKNLTYRYYIFSVLDKILWKTKRKIP